MNVGDVGIGGLASGDPPSEPEEQPMEIDMPIEEPPPPCAEGHVSHIVNGDKESIIFRIPGMDGATITYYSYAGVTKFTAGCPCKLDHRPECRLEHQANASLMKVVSPNTKRASYGRPLGVQFLWLEARILYHDGPHHVQMIPAGEANTVEYIKQERMDARARLKALPGSAVLFNKERPKRRILDGDAFDEDSEPEKAF